MDDVDLAQAREETDRELALKAVRERIALSFVPRDPSVANICIDCDDPIEPERLAALERKTARCSECAHRFEAKTRGAR